MNYENYNKKNSKTMKNKIKKGIVLLIILTMTFIIPGCSSNSQVEGNSDFTEVTDFIADTVITQKVYGKNAETAIKAATQRMREIEIKTYYGNTKSEIAEINRNAGQNYVKISDEVYFLLHKAVYFSTLTKGAFDVTIGPVVKAWGIGTEKASILSQESISSLLKLVSYKDIMLKVNALNKYAMLKKNGQIIDLGGIAKGYMGDEIKRIYRENDVKSALANLGGNVVAIGKRPDGKEWRVGIQDPDSVTGEYLGVVDVSDKAVVTSGDYQRYFIKDGKKYHHIIDPTTGYPSDNDLAGATIIAGISADADALSTAVFVMGSRKGMELIERLVSEKPDKERGKVYGCILIDKSNKVHVSEALSKSFELTDNSGKYSIYTR